MMARPRMIQNQDAPLPSSAGVGGTGEPGVAGGVAWVRASLTVPRITIVKAWSLLNILFRFRPQGLRIDVMMWGMTAGPNVNARKKSAGMIGIGYLAPLILFIVGALVGHLVMGTSGVLARDSSQEWRCSAFWVGFSENQETMNCNLIMTDLISRSSFRRALPLQT